MRDTLKTIGLPIPWAMLLGLLGALVCLHIVAAPIRAFIYWKRLVSGKTAWEALFADMGEIGVYCYPSPDPGERRV